MNELGREKQRAYYKKYREENREKILAYQAKYRASHKDEIKERNRLYWERKAIVPVET